MLLEDDGDPEKDVLSVVDELLEEVGVREQLVESVIL
jgi:hypothetical protein